MTSKNEILITSLEQGRNNLVIFDFLSEEYRFTELKSIIKKRLEIIKKDYDGISKLTSAIVEDKYFWGLIKSTNVEKSIDGLLNIIKELANHTLNAFKTNGENLRDILELMKVLARIENDLYKQLENSDCSKEAIANLLHDFCSQYNIDNQAIEELFEQSFHRTVTLKTRIKDLREEVFSHISNRIDDINKTIAEKESNLNYSINQSNTGFNKKLDSNINRFENLINDIINRQNDTLDTYKRENETLKYETNLLSKKVLKLQGHLKWYSVVSVVAIAIAIIGLMI